MKDNLKPVSWDSAGLSVRRAVCELVGWRTNKGTITRTGARIAATKWDSLSPAARNVLQRHGIKQ